MGLLFALSIPACATPVLVALLGSAATSTAGHVRPWIRHACGFRARASLPIAAATVSERLQRGMDWLSGLTRRIPATIGAWSIYMSLAMDAPA